MWLNSAVTLVVNETSSAEDFVFETGKSGMERNPTWSSYAAMIKFQLQEDPEQCPIEHQGSRNFLSRDQRAR